MHLGDNSSLSDFDLQNLQNIRRQSIQNQGYDAMNLVARDDMKVMREAADNRKRRRIRLPPWANQALAEQEGRSPSESPLESPKT